jgi:hypothetical protein
MALPLVHLSVAYQMVWSCEYRPVPAFYLGSIAPDAIHMRPGTGRKDKREVHLSQDGPIDLDRVRQFIVECWQTYEDSAFAEGYCVHLLTDHYWADGFVRPLQTRLGDTLPRDELRTLYYDECDKIDLELYDQQPWRDDVWKLLESAKAVDLQGFLTQQEVEMWRNRVLHWYDKNRHKGDYQSRLFTQEAVLDFIGNASVRACEQMTLWKRSMADPN